MDINAQITGCWQLLQRCRRVWQIGAQLTSLVASASAEKGRRPDVPVRVYSLYAERLGLLVGLRRTIRLTFHTIGAGDQAVELITP